MATVAKREKILLGIAGVVLLIFVMDRLVCSNKENTDALVINKQPQVLAAEVPSTKPLREQQNIDIEFPITDWGRDPFLRLSQESTKDTITTKGPYLSFKAISWKDGVAYVLINDVVLKKGEEKNGIRLLQVRKNQVVCRKGQKVFTLTLGEKIGLTQKESNNPLLPVHGGGRASKFFSGSK